MALKVLMAVTGLVLVLFILAHMYGNLKLFQGQEAFDGYSHYLREVGYPILPHSGFLWIMRVALLASVVGHIYAAVALWRQANRARSTRYVQHKRLVQTYSARTMRWGGVIIALFVVFHVLQFTTMTIEVGGSYDSPYQRLVAAYQPEHWWVYAVYLVSIVALTAHLRHGLWSATQTLGASNRRRQLGINVAAYVVAGLVLVGFMVPPTAVLLGLVG